jgi:hypothetical protein
MSNRRRSTPASGGLRQPGKVADHHRFPAQYHSDDVRRSVHEGRSSPDIVRRGSVQARTVSNRGAGKAAGWHAGSGRQSAVRHVRVVMYFAPIGAGAAIAFTVGKFGVKTLIDLGQFVLAVFVPAWGSSWRPSDSCRGCAASGCRAFSDTSRRKF